MSGGTARPRPGRRSQSIPELMTVDEVAKALRLSRSKVYALIAGGKLSAYRPGGRLRIPSKSVSEFLQDSRIERNPVR